MQSTFGEVVQLVGWLVLVRENALNGASFIGFTNIKSMALEYISYRLIYGGLFQQSHICNALSEV